MTAYATSRTSGDARFESGTWAKADLGQVAVSNRRFMSTWPGSAAAMATPAGRWAHPRARRRGGAVEQGNRLLQLTDYRPGVPSRRRWQRCRGQDLSKQSSTTRWAAEAAFPRCGHACRIGLGALLPLGHKVHRREMTPYSITSSAVANTRRVCARLTRKPVATAENAKSRKKLDPTKPNSRGLKSSSCLIGTAAIPITGLSAKSINRP